MSAAAGTGLNVISALAVVAASFAFDSQSEAARFAALWSVCQIAAVSFGVGSARFLAFDGQARTASWVAISAVLGAAAPNIYASLAALEVDSAVILAAASLGFVLTQMLCEQQRLAGAHVKAAVLLGVSRVCTLLVPVIASAVSLRQDPELSILAGGLAPILAVPLLGRVQFEGGFVENDGRSLGRLRSWLSFVGGAFVTTLLNFGPNAVVGFVGGAASTAVNLFIGTRAGQLVSLPGVALAAKSASDAVSGRRSGQTVAELKEYLEPRLRVEVAAAGLLSLTGVLLVGVVASLSETLATPPWVFALAMLGYTTGVSLGPAAQVLTFRLGPGIVLAVDTASFVALVAGLALALQVRSVPVQGAAALLLVAGMVAVRNVATCMITCRRLDIRTCYLPSASAIQQILKQRSSHGLSGNPRHR